MGHPLNALLVATPETRELYPVRAFVHPLDLRLEWPIVGLEGRGETFSYVCYGTEQIGLLGPQARDVECHSHGLP